MSLFQIPQPEKPNIHMFLEGVNQRQVIHILLFIFRVILSQGISGIRRRQTKIHANRGLRHSVYEALKARLHMSSVSVGFINCHRSVDPLGIEKPFAEGTAVRCSCNDFPTVEVELFVYVFSAIAVAVLSLPLCCFLDLEPLTVSTGVGI